MSTESAQAPAIDVHEESRRPSLVWRALIGVAAAAASLAVSELLSGLLSVGNSLIESVGELVIDLSPPAVTKFAIELFGLYDKLALVVGIVVVSLVFGALLGILSTWGAWIPTAGFFAFGLLGAYAGVSDPQSSPLPAVLVAGVSVAAGLLVFRRLLNLAERAALAEVDGAPASPERRALLIGVGAVGVLAAASAGLGRVLLQRIRIAAASRAEVILPIARNPAPEPGAAASFNVAGLAPLVTPNDDFYKIDTALSVPRVDPQLWNLSITGMVDRPIQMSYEDLLDMPMVERYITLCCVSNEVGGELISNAKWLGVPLPEVLTRAGVKEEATQIVGRSVDEFTVGFPTEVAFDGREALVAVGMNGEPLPFDHGFPARLVVAGLYGYVSATKWLSEIELTLWDAFDAYWIPRGWAKEGPVKTQSRIDIPQPNTRLSPGLQRIAGVAWAQNRGITRVEIQVNQGSWQDASVSEPINKDTWVQWVYDWDAPPGEHLVRVRATDATGVTQTSEWHPPRPDGATGHHTVRVFVG